MTERNPVDLEDRGDGKIHPRHTHRVYLKCIQDQVHPDHAFDIIRELYAELFEHQEEATPDIAGDCIKRKHQLMDVRNNVTGAPEAWFLQRDKELWGTLLVDARDALKEEEKELTKAFSKVKRPVFRQFFSDNILLEIRQRVQQAEEDVIMRKTLAQDLRTVIMFRHRRNENNG